jgi:hypothetical protein
MGDTVEHADHIYVRMSVKGMMASQKCNTETVDST